MGACVKEIVGLAEMESRRLAVLHVRLDLSTYYLPDGRLLDLEMVTTMV